MTLIGFICLTLKKEPLGNAWNEYNLFAPLALLLDAENGTVYWQNIDESALNALFTLGFRTYTTEQFSRWCETSAFIF